MKNPQPWNRQTELLLTGLVTLSSAPHIYERPAWIWFIFISVISWKLLFLFFGTRLPHKRAIGLLSVTMPMIVFSLFGTLLSPEALGLLLSLLVALKLLEMLHFRDGMFTVFTTLFLLITAALQSQTLSMTIHVATGLLFLTALMFRLNNQDVSPVHSLRPALRLLALSMPIWIGMFLVFPRFSAAFLKGEARRAEALLSREVDPGSISQLALDDAIAFRARIHYSSRSLGEDDFYWRGQVLSYSDGLRWIPTRVPGVIGNSDKSETFDINYEVLFNRSWAEWIFALESPITVTTETRTGTIRSTPENFFQIVAHRLDELVYSGQSSFAGQKDRLDGGARTAYLQVPANLPDNVRFLAAQIKLEAGSTNSAEGFAQSLDRWFLKEKFKYTLNPGNQSTTLSDFLFNGKKGFCEHFSAASGVLLRLMGVPARVVIGFQGGEFNPISGLYIIRNRDAHAWLEYFVDSADGFGYWKRYDPTSTIAPARIFQGSQSLQNDLSVGALSKFVKYLRLHLRQFEMVWDALQSQWSLFFLRYDLNYQLQLLAKLGLGGLPRWLGILIGWMASFALIAVFAILLFYFVRKRASSNDPSLELWNVFSNKFHAAGHARQPTEGPLQYSHRLCARFPDYKQQIQEITNEYIQARYQFESPDRASIRRLKKQISRFTLRRS